MVELKNDPVIREIETKVIERNGNYIIFINGPTGSGKTYAAIRLAYDLSKKHGLKFSAKGNIDFKFTNLLRKMEIPENSKPGTCFIFEEVGTVGGGASTHEWQTKSNAFFSSFLQTDRHNRRVLIMTCPSFSSLQLSSRRLVHMQISARGINYRSKISFLKVYKLQPNDRTGKIYYKLLRFKLDGIKRKLRWYRSKLPPKSVTEPYERMKTEFTSLLRKQIIESEDGGKKKEEKVTWICKICKYEWVPRSKTPAYCVRCQKRDISIK